MKDVQISLTGEKEDIVINLTLKAVTEDGPYTIIFIIGTGFTKRLKW